MISNIFSWPAFWGDHLSFPLEGNASQPTSSHICKFQSVWLLIQFQLLGSVIITASVQKGNGRVQSDKESTGVGSCYNQQGPAMIKGDWGISWLRNEDSWSSVDRPNHSALPSLAISQKAFDITSLWKGELVYEEFLRIMWNQLDLASLTRESMFSLEYPSVSIRSNTLIFTLTRIVHSSQFWMLL